MGSELIHRKPERHPRNHSVIEIAPRGEVATREQYGWLEERLEGRDYFCGQSSVADIAMFMTVLWALRLKGAGPGDHPALAGWHARIGARPAVARAARVSCLQS